MADNVTLDAGAGGDTISADDIAGVKVQRVKVQYGADGAATDVSDSNPLPVDDAGGSLTVDNAGAFAVQVDAALPAGANAIGKLAANSGVDIGDVDVTSEPATAADGGALPAVQKVVAGYDGTNTQAVKTDADGILQVDVLTAPTTTVDDGGGTITVDDGGASLTVDVGTALPAGTNNIGDVDVASSALPTGAATSALQTTGNTALSAIQTSVETLDNAIAGTEMQVDVVGALPAGTNNIGDVDVASIAAGANTIGNVGVVPRTSGGLSIFRSIDLDETEEEIKATAGQVFGWFLFNAHSATLYVKFYNATAANVTVGTTTPVLTIPVPAGAAANVFGEIGIAFGTAITAACTTGLADADTGAPGANLLIANVFYA